MPILQVCAFCAIEKYTEFKSLDLLLFIQVIVFKLII